MDKLSPQHLPLLFDEPIYVLAEQALPAPGPTTPPLPANFKGRNKKGVLIVNEDALDQPIDPADEEFVFKAFNKLGITLDDVAIIAHSETAIHQIEHRIRIVFQQNPDAGNLYQITHQDGIRQLCCHTIATISQNRELKIKLWSRLQELFPGD